MSVSRNEWIGFVGFVGALIAAGMLAVWASACEHGSKIPIDPEPSCTESVTDECVPEIIEEFCAQPEECEPPVRECYKSRRKLICVNKFTGKSCRYDDRDRMCRFEYRLERIDCPQAALRCDRNCDPSDPICIPCDLEEIARNCVTQCFPSGNGGTICTTSCTGANGAEA